jgi:hypothetical protein
MTATNLDLANLPAVGVESSPLKVLFIEPLLVVGVSAFWLVTLPFVAAALVAMKLWDTLTCRPDPLFLREWRLSNAVLGRPHNSVSKAAHA